MEIVKKQQRERNPEKTYSSILRSAERLFARKGFAGTSMSQIAEASGVSQPLIHHHFGNKESLYRAVKSDVMKRIFEAWEYASEGENGIDSFETRIRTVWRFIGKHPTFIRLVEWSRLEDKDDFWPGEERLVRALHRHIKGGQEEGLFRDDIDPMVISVMAQALVLFWWEDHNYAVRHFGGRAVVNEHYLEQMLKVFMSGISNQTESENTKGLEYVGRNLG
ncbi:MAG: TetR/AcrR family transcriptional regulator [Verrucomicrobiota bacterium]